MKKITRHNYELFFTDFIDGKLSEEYSDELNLFLHSNPDLADELTLVSDIKLNEKLPNFNFQNLKRSIEDLPFDNDCADELIISLLENDYPHSRRDELQKWIESDKKLKKDFSDFQKIKLQPCQFKCVQKDRLYRLPDFEIDNITVENAEMFAVAEFENDLSIQSFQKLNDWKKSNSTLKNNKFDFSKTRLQPDKSLIFKHKSKLYKKQYTKIRALYTTIAAIAAALTLYYGIFRNQPENIPVISEINVAETKTNENQTITEETTFTETVHSDIKHEKIAVLPQKRNTSINISTENQSKLQENKIIEEYSNIEKIDKITISLDFSYSDNKEVFIPDFEEFGIFYYPEESSNSYLKILNPKTIVSLLKEIPLKETSIAVTQRVINRINDRSKNIQIELFFNDENKFELFAMQTPLFEIEKVRSR